MIKVGEQLPSAKLFKLGEKGVDTIESTEYLACLLYTSPSPRD